MIHMAHPRCIWIIISVLCGFSFSVFILRSLLTHSTSLDSSGLVPIPWIPVDKTAGFRRYPPTQLLQFQSTKKYTDLLSASSSYSEVEDAFFERMSVLHVLCSPKPHLGRDGNGGWETCLAKSFRPQKPCLVYDFGVNDVWEFDEVLARTYGCTVRAFDPSMNKGDFVHVPGPVHFYAVGLGGSNRQLQNGWRLRTLPSLLQRFGEALRTIDVLKIDIEYYEWEALEQLLTTRVLQRTKQLLMEVHTLDVRGKAPSKDHFLFYHSILDRLEALGFRKFHSHANPRGIGALVAAREHAKGPDRKRSAQLDRTCCFELHYVNVNFAEGLRQL